MILASSTDLGKSDVLVKLAGDLTEQVRRAVQDGTSLDVLERGVFQQLLLILQFLKARMVLILTIGCSSTK